MAKKKVPSAWLVVTGQYSDYHVLCVALTKNDAQAIAKKYGGGAYLEEVFLLTKDAEPERVLRMEADIFDIGGVEEATPEVTQVWPFDILWSDVLVPVRWRWHRFVYGNGGRLVVVGTDHERVRKVYSDRKAAILADPALIRLKKQEGTR